MQLNNYHQLQKFKFPWYCFCTRKEQWAAPNTVCVLEGPKGSGKTQIALEFMKQHAGSIYFSFAGLSDDMAIRFFCDKMNLRTDMEHCNDWKNVFATLSKYITNGRTVLVFDDVDGFLGRDVFLAALSKFINNPENPWAFVVLPMRDSTCLRGKGITAYAIHSTYRTIANIKKSFPTLSNKDVLRLYAVSGGIPSLLGEYNTNLSFEENLKSWLSYDSVFYRFLPELMKEHFRAPETYNALMYSIATAHHRISEIAKDVGFPYNKCDKYIGALQAIGLVKSKQQGGSKRSLYYLANSYLSFWYRYLYPNLDRITPTVENSLLDTILSELDSDFTVPCYHQACRKWLKRNSSLYHSKIYDLLRKDEDEPLVVRLDHGETFTFEVSLYAHGHMLLAKLPGSLHERYDKALFLKTIKAAEQANLFYNNTVIIFSPHRFSDYCVHEVSKLPNVKLITIERLKY